MTTVGTTVNYGAGSIFGSSGGVKGAEADDVFADLFDDTDAAAEDATGAASSPPPGATFKFMGQVVTATSLAINMKHVDIAELPEAEYQAAMDIQLKGIEMSKKSLEHQYSEYFPPDLSSEPRVQPYATVVVGGRVVAKIDNQGCVESSDADYLRFKGILSDGANDTNGPDLAQRRAEEIAAVVGGKVQKSSTAITQSQFNALPAVATGTVTVDYDAMKNDPDYGMIQNMYANLENLQQRRADYLAKQ